MNNDFTAEGYADIRNAQERHVDSLQPQLAALGAENERLKKRVIELEMNSGKLILQHRADERKKTVEEIIAELRSMAHWEDDGTYDHAADAIRHEFLK